MSITAVAVLAIYLMGILLAFTRHPFFALLSYLWIFYNDPAKAWWSADIPDLRYSLIAAVAAFISALSLRSPQSNWWQDNAGAKLIAAYALWMWVQVPWAINLGAHLDGTILATKYVVLYYTIYKIASEEKLIEGFLWAHIVGCFLLGWTAFTSNVTGRLESLGGPGADDANLLAAHMVTGVAIAGFMFVGLPGYRRLAAFLMIPFILNTIILTQSRAAALATIASLPAAWYLTPKAQRRFVLIAVVLAAVLFLSLANEEFWNRISTILGIMGETTQEVRLEIIGPQFRMFLDHPLGTGHRGNEFLSPQYIPMEFLAADTGTRSAHNIFMAALVDQGFPGLILLTGLCAWVGVSLRRLKLLDAQGLPPLLGLYRAALGTALVSCFVSGLFSNMLKAEVQIWLVALLASLIARSKSAVEKLNNSDLPVAGKESPH